MCLIETNVSIKIYFANYQLTFTITLNAVPLSLFQERMKLIWKIAAKNLLLFHVVVKFAQLHVAPWNYANCFIRFSILFNYLLRGNRISFMHTRIHKVCKSLNIGYVFYGSVCNLSAEKTIRIQTIWIKFKFPRANMDKLPDM